LNYAGTLCLVLLAAYGLASLWLSLLAAGLWRVWLERKPLTSRCLLALRLLPPTGALFLTLSVVLPAFLINEPSRSPEPVGPVLMLMAAVALTSIGAGFWRGGRALAAAAALLQNCGPRVRRCRIAGQPVDIFEASQPMVAVVGAWKPRIVAAEGVVAVCSPEEFRQVIGHEAAHLSAHDNLKLLLLISAPDMLAWMPAGGDLIARWRAEVEFEADCVATGPDRRKRAALAAALIKVARLSIAKRPIRELSMPIVADDVELRVRRLLAPAPPAPLALPIKLMAVCALLIGVVAVPLYGLLHESIEVLVALGR
jgi:Zn-dependent protease with chaperone function